jgi:hypothetical protein
LQAHNGTRSRDLFLSTAHPGLVSQWIQEINHHHDIQFATPRTSLGSVSFLLQLFLKHMQDSIWTDALHVEFLKLESLHDSLKLHPIVRTLCMRLPPSNYRALRKIFLFLGQTWMHRDENGMTPRLLYLGFGFDDRGRRFPLNVFEILLKDPGHFFPRNQQ